MTAKRWMLLGSLAVIGGITSIGCGDSSGDDDGDGGTAGTNASGSAGVGPAGSGGSGTSGSSGSSTGGSAGSTPTGGTAGTGGTPPTAGSAGTGGSMGGAGGATGGSAGASGAAGGSGGSGGGVACEHTISQSMVSEKIKTVGIVEWSTNLPGVTSARIEFGLDTTYGMTAPVTTVGATNRTLLLGMKQDSTYHYRIVATSPEGDCAGPDQTIVTDFLPSGLPTFEIETLDASKVYGGYHLMGNYTQTPGGGAAAYIIDPDGDIVWAYLVPMRDVTGVRMSYDGQYMWLNSANVPENQGANVHRITMDGLMDEDLSEEFEGANHQLTVLPDETVGFYAYASGGSNCDDVKEYDPSTGMVKLIVNSGTAHGASGPCHLNAIEYAPAEGGAEEGYLFSDLHNDNITKITRTGEKVWVIGGETNEFTGTGTTWDNQHGIDVLSANSFVFFNNGPNNANSAAVEMTLDLEAMTAERTWEYQSERSINNIIMGDVQRLENGNTLVGYSTKGVMHEVDPEGNLVQEIVWGSTGYFGYIQMRKSLYGPPPR